MRPVFGIVTVGMISMCAGLALGQDAASQDGVGASEESGMWEGFLTGQEGFRDFYEPMGMPYYFESPFNRTEVRVVYIHHEFPSDIALDGGDVDIYAVQVRVALTERLGFIATKDGYSDMSTGLLGDESGWNNIAAGLKYVFIQDEENDFVLSAGLRYEIAVGDEEILQGGSNEWSPFVSVAKGFDKLHLIGNLSYRLPEDTSERNEILSWSAHVDYELFPDTLGGIAPMVEVHGLHYLSDGNQLGLEVGGLDYGNIGSSMVSGDTVVWMGLGARAKLNEKISFGGTYEFPLTSADEDIIENRITMDLRFVW